MTRGNLRYGQAMLSGLLFRPRHARAPGVRHAAHAAHAALGALLLAACSGGPAPEAPLPPEVALGQRLFRESRFAQFFAARAGGDVNRALTEGDPALETVAAPAGERPGPYRGSTISCAACHLSDELGPTAARSFADFARRSRQPDRPDGHALTTRNAVALRGALVPGLTGLLHFDGEHASIDELVTNGLTGRTFGWLPAEHDQAVAHVAAVIRGDRGGAQPAYKARFADLPAPFGLDVDGATDQQVLAAVSRLIGAYVSSLQLHTDGSGAYSGSPYDRFLRKNGLPTQPAPGETVEEYGRRLYMQLAGLARPAYVGAGDGHFSRHAHPFVFGATELIGLMTFLGQPGDPPTGPPGTWACSSCHPPPHFTDFSFHNTGVAELDYDRMFGRGSFAALVVPGLSERRQNEAAFLPPSQRLPAGSSVFREIPDPDHPGRTDLGVWNVVANDDAPAAQQPLQQALCPPVKEGPMTCDPGELLPRTIGLFKTRGLRDLGHSGPYFHNGQADTLEQVVTHYLVASLAMKSGQLRNGDIALEWLMLGSGDIGPLAAFLRSLDED
jgi:cytochrome c peroxidase